MAKVPLKKFTAFASALLPHEVAYLQRVQRFEDPDNIAILDRLFHNARHPRKPKPFDQAIDKRKYSKLKKWIQDHLHRIDVDRELRYIQDTEYKILTDTIGPKEEEELTEKMARCSSNDFHFLRFYELIERYSHYLLVRMRYPQHDITKEFVSEFQSKYNYAQKVFRQLYQVTQDIVEQYRTGRKESKQWEPMLRNYYFDTSLDGLSRYTAMVRITFIHINYRDFDGLEPIFEHMDELLQEGKIYSRNILANYYSNRVILHSRLEEWSKAERYGYLSIKHKNNDHLQYVNTLVGILLRQGKYKMALEVMREALPFLKQTKSSHNRSGFASFYIHTLQLNNRPQEAERYAKSFLRVYDREIFEHRWHTFFSFYFETLSNMRKWNRIVHLTEHYDLMKRDEDYKNKAGYLPTINWYYQIALFSLGQTKEEELKEGLFTAAKDCFEQSQKRQLLKQLTKKLEPFAPKALTYLYYHHLR